MAMPITHPDVLSVRASSRRMVRELGFMQSTLAGTDLSPSAVHAIIEIGTRGSLTANRLAQDLVLEKSTVSRLLARLLQRGLVTEKVNAADARSKLLSLTDTGRALLSDIDNFANLRVGQALHSLSWEKREAVVEGLRAYAGVLEQMRTADAGADAAEIKVVEGFQPGAIGRIAEMHGRYYARQWNFPPVFEAKVAGGLAEFVPRLGKPVNQMWLAIRDGAIVGSAVIDGEDLGEGKAHLRWVIVDEHLKGAGTGRRLVTEAVEFCDTHGFAEIHLWTFRGLDAARRLYESVRFVLAEEWTGSQWGINLPEQRFVRLRKSDD